MTGSGSPRTPFVSIVIAGDDHESPLDEWYRALGTQSAPSDSYEVIVVDGFRIDKHAEAAQRFLADADDPPAIRVAAIDSEKRSAALNEGLRLATGEIIVFLGDDALPALELVEAHRRFHLEHPAIGYVGIGTFIIPDELRTPFVDWAERSGRQFGLDLHDAMREVPEDFFYIANASVKRPLLEKAGPFDERLPFHAWDDLELGMRLRSAGMTARLVPDARAVHTHRIDRRGGEMSHWNSGVSAHILEQFRPAPHPWAPTVSHAPWLLRVVAALWRLRHAVTRDQRALHRFYQYRYAAAFSAGYRAAASGKPLEAKHY